MRTMYAWHRRPRYLVRSRARARVASCAPLESRVFGARSAVAATAAASPAAAAAAAARCCRCDGHGCQLSPPGPPTRQASVRLHAAADIVRAVETIQLARARRRLHHGRSRPRSRRGKCGAPAAYPFAATRTYVRQTRAPLHLNMLAIADGQT